MRAADFIPQIRKEITLTAHDVSKGLFLILTGLFKKVVISDFIYLNLVQYVFDDPLRHTGMECLFAVYGYAREIYRDWETDRKSTRLNSSHSAKSRMPSSA